MRIIGDARAEAEAAARRIAELEARGPLPPTLPRTRLLRRTRGDAPSHPVTQSPARPRDFRHRAVTRAPCLRSLSRSPGPHLLPTTPPI